MRILLALSGLLLAASPGTAAEWSQLSGQFSRIREHRAVVVLDAEAWRRLWNEHTGGAADMPLPEADFSREAVVAVFAGQRRTTGHSVQMDVRRDAAEDSVNVVYALRPPDRDGFHSPALTQPYMIRKFPRPAGALTVERADRLGKALQAILGSVPSFD